MDYFHTEEKRERTNYKFVGQLLFIILVEVIIFLITHKHAFTNNSYTHENHSTLILVQLLFRHGERTPATVRSYPNDPYINDTFEPYGPENLTYEGEKTMYQLGILLRTYYGSFLGEYQRGVVYAQTSFLNRCKRSLLLVLASLFPPSIDRQFQSGLKWQPIEYYYDSSDTDYVFNNMLNCKKFVELREAKGKRIFKSMQAENIYEISRYIESHTGMKIGSMIDMMALYDLLQVQSEIGLKLPNWTEKVFPNPLESYFNIEYAIPSKSDDFKRLASGFLFKEILDAIHLKINAQNQRRKIHLYSGHDYNLVALLGTLGVILQSRPTYGSFISVELHKLHNEYAIKVVHYDRKSEQFAVIKLPECEEMCPIQTFLKLYKKYQATPDMC